MIMRQQMEALLRSYVGRVVGYTSIFGVYQVLALTGGPKLAKDPRPIEGKEEFSESEGGGEDYCPLHSE